MRYLGSLTCSGILEMDGERAPARFEFECYLAKMGSVAASGELTTSPSALKKMHGVRDVDFLADTGHHLKLTLSDKKATPTGASADVVAAGDLPVFKDGVLQWLEPADARAA
ncbi:hypothetical protein GCM10008179_14130 [Hansschlegelia plantiphila]|uniref:Uncharacterized protein n=2 Tax=Hansschlegelia plantiphila TaxID=374655 RepID=A0A9W6J1Z2_9HYPH|nr:hypothetical protein GCM10008179_14130 [Hansschlegelia plantiphila]